MVPEAELTEKASPVEVKEKKCEEKIELTRMLKFLEKNYASHHLAWRISFARQGTVEYFKTIHKAKERVNNSPK